MDDFKKIEELMKDMIDDGGKPEPKTLKQLKHELNSCFRGTECNDIIITNNTHNLFYGMCVYPIIDDRTADKILVSDEPYTVQNYVIDIDSKLFDPMLGLTPREMTAIILHEVGHLTNTSRPTEEIRKAIDLYCAKNNTTIKLNMDHKLNSILCFAIADAMLKVTSVFYDKDEEFKADSFVFKCGYGKDLESAMMKIYKKGLIVNKNVNDKFIVMSWAFRLFTDVRHKRISALRTINKAKDLVASSEEKKQLSYIEKCLRDINFSELRESTYLTEGIIAKKFLDIKVSGTKGFENDLYEYRMMIKNIDEQDEAIMVMRQINNRITVLEDLLEDPNLSKSRFEKLENLLREYKELRSTLAKTITYKDRLIGVIVNYPAIKGLDY